jgi:ribonuclease HI
MAKIVSTFTVQALAIGETPEIIEKIDSEQNFVIFLDSESVLKGISNISTTNNTSHITQMFKDKTERLELQGIKIQFYYIPGHCGVEVKDRADSEAKQSIKEGRDSQLLLPVADLKAQWKKRQRGASQFLSKHQKGQEE